MSVVRHLLCAGFLLLCLAPGVQAEDIDFPALSGRVVDDASLLNSSTRNQLNAQLQAHEKASGNQIVVVTLPDLQGYPIEEYGYRLGRHWGIGQKDKNNGVLLIVAKKERKVRIEVGYGLEGALTDAISSNIINAVIVPRFKKADFNGGIAAGVDAIIQALGGSYTMTKAPTHHAPTVGQIIFGIIMLYFLAQMLFAGFWGGGRGGRGGGYWGGGFGGGGFSGGGGGFSGGGGSFGGGGASGGW